MYRFQCDYTEGAHPAIMQRMVETNMEQTDGYGLDPYCDSARQKIKDLCECQDADVHFLVGGTQTNTTVISAALLSQASILCATHPRVTPSTSP
mgnify:CR=1 FL=1